MNQVLFFHSVCMHACMHDNILQLNIDLGTLNKLLYKPFPLYNVYTNDVIRTCLIFLSSGRPARTTSDHIASPVCHKQARWAGQPNLYCNWCSSSCVPVVQRRWTPPRRDTTLPTDLFSWCWEQRLLSLHCHQWRKHGKILSSSVNFRW